VEACVTVKRRLGVRARVAIGLAVAAALLGGGWIWVRDSSLVAVQRVSIAGVYGPDAGQIRSALRLAALNMTTLDVRLGQLRTAVAPYPVVKHLRVSTQFPHGMRIQVVEQLPLGALVAGGESVAASGDGTLLRDVPTASLPAIPVSSLPGGSTVTDGAALNALTLLAATPPRLAARIAQVTTNSGHGLVAELRSGPSIYFGDATDLGAKWASATAVLAAPSSAGASYIDVTDPSRPAAGVSEQAVTAAGLATTGAQSTGSQTAGSSGTGSSTTPSSGG
jgi:cell division protein FtsQ